MAGAWKRGKEWADGTREAGGGVLVVGVVGVVEVVGIEQDEGRGGTHEEGEGCQQRGAGASTWGGRGCVSGGGWWQQGGFRGGQEACGGGIGGGPLVGARWCRAPHADPGWVSR